MAGIDVLKTLENIIGQDFIRVKVINTFDTEYTGTIYTYNATPGTLVLETPGSNPTLKANNYKVIRTSHIKSLQVINNTTTAKSVSIQPIATSHIPKIIKANEENSLLINKTRNSRVSKNGQFVFDTVYKRMPTVRWGPNHSIIVLDEVKIEEPYTSMAIKPLKGAEVNDDLVELLKRIVDDVWHKIDNERKGG
ncbi:hypothetical protein WICPIJ_002712 [Wickerhamomyces pijperi]|uniref:AD domain-containing protein n=1 Tax=Wickerhamomyces pijperi TaxID=599730 RepID=A0A9P8QBA2_WICPI|nr:hypothetical protein WICPIJ_002712 [Wickerhamomyces pijperi]